MKLQQKLALFNALTKIMVIIFLGSIILFSIDKIAYKHSDSRLIKKYHKLIDNLDEHELDSLVHQNNSFTDYNILKDEFIVISSLKEKKFSDTSNHFFTDERDVKGDIEFYRILNKNFKYNGTAYNLELGLNMTSTNALKSTLRWYLLIVLIIALIITSIADITFYKILLKPFYQIINKKLRNVEHPNQFDYQLIETNTSDFIFLDQSINQLFQKINELFNLEKQFIANVSHELLTPLSILNNRIENILTSQTLTESNEERLNASLKTISKLKSIINGLLLISRIENNQFIKQDKINLEDEIKDIIAELEERIESKKINVSNLMNINYEYIGNKTLINILFTNLILNAIKYNKAEGSIIITDQLDNGKYTIKIHDTGIGMDNEFKSKLFQRFTRANNNESGFGLGLSIAQSIINFHQIEIDLNTELGKFTEITLKF